MFITDLFFPKFCLGCGYIGVYICTSCLEKLKPVQLDTCIYCQKPSLFGLTHSNCIKDYNIDGILAIYHYNPILKKIIKNMKYRLAMQVWKDFNKSIEPHLIMKLGFYNRLSAHFVLQPIPLTKNKCNERGFNQAQTICTFFNMFLNFPIVNLLTREKQTFSQAQIKTKRDRYLNIKGKFISIKTPPDNIILVDDVVTSGSTIREATKVLKIAGTKKVYVLALAKG